MKQKAFLAIALAVVAMSAAAKGGEKRGQIVEVPFTKVHLNDVFWSPRIETNRTVSIPSAFRECEKNGRFDNFLLAGLNNRKQKGQDVTIPAGLEHKGDFSFDDTDPYKVIEGASYSLAVHYDKKLDHYLDSVIGLIAQAQEPDGYLTTCVTNQCKRLSGWWGTRKWEKINSHELYNSGHMIESAVAHYKATGKRTFLNVAIKNADLVCRTFGPGEGQIHRPGGHPIIEMALCKLYLVTGNKRYLEGAKYFCDETGRCTDGHQPSEYSQDHMPILQQDEIVGHAVRAGYLYSGVADVAALTGDAGYQEALKRIWENMASKKLFITGGIGSRPQGEGFGPNYELHNMTAYCETCAAIANVYWNYRMFLATGDAKYVDVYERALYNGVVSGVSLSGDKFFYDNPLESMGQHDRAPWFGCACCPGNVTRFVASVSNYVYAAQGDDIFVNLFIQGTATIGKVQLSQQTTYPWEGAVTISVDKTSGRQYAINVRIPGWAQNKPVSSNLYTCATELTPYTVKVNGKAVSGTLVNGFLSLNRKWKKGDKIEVTLPMEVQRIKANDNAVDDRGKTAVCRGPVVYCLEGVDQHDSVVFNKYITPSTTLMPQLEKDLLGGIVVLKGKAGEVRQDGSVADVDVRMIPYCTWDNRGANQMAVWVPESPAYATVTPKPTIASHAKAMVYQGAIQKDAPETASAMGEAWGINDQWEPRCSSDISKPYHYWWLKTGTSESVAYEFDKEYEVSNVQVYWLVFDHYDGNYRVPEYWNLYYQTADGRWEEVSNHTPYGVAPDCYNSVDFTPVRTKGLKIVAKLQKGESGGIIEWKVNK